MKQIKDAIKNNAILLTSIDLIGVILYLMLMKKICDVNFNFTLYDFSIITTTLTMLNSFRRFYSHTHTGGNWDNL